MLIHTYVYDMYMPTHTQTHTHTHTMSRRDGKVATSFSRVAASKVRVYDRPNRNVHAKASKVSCRAYGLRGGTSCFLVSYRNLCTWVILRRYALSPWLHEELRSFHAKLLLDTTVRLATERGQAGETERIPFSKEANIDACANLKTLCRSFLGIQSLKKKTGRVITHNQKRTT